MPFPREEVKTHSVEQNFLSFFNPNSLKFTFGGDSSIEKSANNEAGSSIDTNKLVFLNFTFYIVMKVFILKFNKP